MEIPDSLAFEVIGRKEVALEVQRRQIQELSSSLRRAQESEAQWRERATLAVQPKSVEAPSDE